MAWRLHEIFHAKSAQLTDLVQDLRNHHVYLPTAWIEFNNSPYMKPLRLVSIHFTFHSSVCHHDEDTCVICSKEPLTATVSLYST